MLKEEALATARKPYINIYSKQKSNNLQTIPNPSLNWKLLLHEDLRSETIL